LCVIAFMIAFGRVVEALAVARGRRDMVAETRMLMVADIVLLLLPAMYLIAYVTRMSIKYDTHPLSEMHAVFHYIHPLALLVLLLPISLTLSLTWAAKDAVLQQLDTETSASSDPDNDPAS